MPHKIAFPMIALATICAAAASAQANEPVIPPPHGADYERIRKSVDGLCSRTASRPPSNLGKRIAELARDEFYIFGGHQINEKGMLFSFGVVESEHTEKGSGAKAQLSHLGWWNVGRYWRSLMEANSKRDSLPPTLLDAAAILSAVSMGGAVDGTELTASASRYTTKVGQALKLLNELTIEDSMVLKYLPHLAELSAPERQKHVKELLAESVLRAAVSDTAWSAAFISHLLASAAKKAAKKPVFKYSSEHATYIGEAFNVAADERKSGAYRACPLDQAMPREGDLVCYTRAEWRVAEKWRNAHEATTRNMKNSDMLWWEHLNNRRASSTHCDVVAHIDPQEAKPRFAYVVGGNVQQAVTVKRLVLDSRAFAGQAPSNTVLPVQPQECDEKNQWGWGSFPVPANSIQAAPQVATFDSKKKRYERSRGCSLNRKDWFVLLQLRE